VESNRQSLFRRLEHGLSAVLRRRYVRRIRRAADQRPRREESDSESFVVRNALSQGETIYFRGARNFEAIFDELLSLRGLASATEVLLAGCSSGGLSTFLHADQVRSVLPASVKFGAVAMSGVFLNHSIYNTSSEFVYGQQMRAIYEMQNVTVPERCRRANANDPGAYSR
jgi:hypothetical protein